jgi:hypothetical protein
MQQQRLDSAMVEGDLGRRAQMMGNIISNAPNIAAISGINTVDQLANMFADAEAPIFNTPYGQQQDQLRVAGQLAAIAARNRSAHGKPEKEKVPEAGQWYYDPNTNQNKFVKWSEVDNAPWQIDIQAGGVPWVPIPTPPDMMHPSTVRPGTPPEGYNGGGTDDGNGRINFPDGSYVEDGVAYDAQGNPL